MTFDEAIKFWFERINFEIKSARPSDLKLERMSAFLDRLGRPQDRLRIVHVTGTKGKGSTVALIASVLRTAGYRVGQFTSPHLVDVRERMKIDGELITREELAALLTEIAPVVRSIESREAIGPTYFEIGTALGFLHFLRRRVDVAVIEVGLGGRFDSTNICLPIVSIITSIGFDHMAQLGRTLAEIAYQKAGIIKPRIPVVCGMVGPEAAAVIESVAQSQSSPLLMAGRDFQYEYSSPNRAVIDGKTTVDLAMPGEHQAANAAVAATAVATLRQAGLVISQSSLVRGLESARCPGRIEVIQRNPTIVLDTAHNVPSIEALVRALRELAPHARRRVCVFAVSSDKQYTEMIMILDQYFDEYYLTRYSNNSRSVNPELIRPLVKKPCRVFGDANSAWESARSSVDASDLICITGSIFLAGELNLAVRI